MALSREEERDEAQEKNQRKKDGHERLDEKEGGGGSSRVYARMSACAPLLTYARAYAHGARLPPACVFIFIIILDIFYISYK